MKKVVDDYGVAGVFLLAGAMFCNGFAFLIDRFCSF